MLVVGLLGGTAAAFAVTEGLKLQRSPITSTKVDTVFSPVCGCRTGRASIQFSLRKADRLTVAIERAGKVVRTIVRGRPTPRGRVRVFWDGKDDSGALLPDGSYVPKVH